MANNVLAHVPDLDDFVGGFEILCGDNTTITVENPSFVTLLTETQFDTIYHEHFSYFTLRCVELVFAEHALVVHDVEELGTHGGSLRVHAGHAAARRAVSERVLALRAKEEEAGLHRIEGYAGFASQVELVKDELVEFLVRSKREGKTVVGYVRQTPYPHDPARARALLAEAGLKDGFTAELKFAAELYPKQKEIAETIAAQLGAVGIKVKVTPQDQALWVQELLALKWDMEIVGAASPAGDGDDPLRRLWHSNNKRLTWSSPQLDKLLLDQQAEVDPAKRLRIFGGICKLLYEEGPVVYLLNDVELYGVRDRVTGFVSYPDQILRLYPVGVK